METVKVSTKFQIVIPKNVRETLELKSGEEFQIAFILISTVHRTCAASARSANSMASPKVWNGRMTTASMTMSS